MQDQNLGEESVLGVAFPDKENQPTLIKGQDAN